MDLDFLQLKKSRNITKIDIKFKKELKLNFF